MFALRNHWGIGSYPLLNRGQIANGDFEDIWIAGHFVPQFYLTHFFYQQASEV